MKKIQFFILLLCLPNLLLAQAPLKVKSRNNILKAKDTCVEDIKTVLPKGYACLPKIPEPKAIKILKNKHAVPLAGQQAYYGKMTDFMNDFVRQYFGVHVKTICNVKHKCKPKFSIIDNILVKHQIPKELKYLSVIESALNNNAISAVGAVGPWQFMETTAKEMGLTISETKDDRTDWYKSTNAAAKYLNRLYGMLNDWLLVVAAYNSGPAPVLRAIDKTNSHNFWDIKKYLPRETQGHVMAFVATATIFETLGKYIGMPTVPAEFKFQNEIEAANAKMRKGTKDTKGITEVKKIEPPKIVFTEAELKSMAIVRLAEPVNFELLHQELGIDKKILQKWNPDYDLFLFNSYATPYYDLRLPKDILETFLIKKEYILRTSAKIFQEQGY